MKKTLLILLVTIVLAACGSDKTDTSEPNEEPAKEPNQSEETDSGEAEKDVSENEEEVEGNNEEESVATDNSAIESFDEYDVIADHIDLNEYTGIVETDNKGNRVILFEDANGSKEFKSVFVKNDKRLKIIKLKDDGLLFNEIID